MKRRPANPVLPDAVTAVRRFNRFHTKLVGALRGAVLTSRYSLPQVRLLYEIANAPTGRPASAAALGRNLGLDAGYLSRLLRSLERAGLLERIPSAENAKRLDLDLSGKGRTTFAALDAASAREVEALLETLTQGEQRQLVGAMHRIEQLFQAVPQSSTFVLRDPEPGDLGWIVHRQSLLYAREYGWDWTFEAMAAEIVSNFARQFDAGRERCWIAERDGEIVGSVFIVREDDETARLRMLYVEQSARGLGLGRKLVDECLRFARKCGYRRMVLWTNDVLVSARRIYEAAGFILDREEAHRSFGHDLTGQFWSRDL